MNLTGRLAGIPGSRVKARDDLVTALGADKETKKPIIKRYGMTEAGISGSRIGMRDDLVTASKAA